MNEPFRRNSQNDVAWPDVAMHAQALLAEANAGQSPHAIREHARHIVAALNGVGAIGSAQHHRLRLEPLTDREQRYLQLAGEGETTIGIANHLDLSANTVSVLAVRTHKKLGAVNRPNAVALSFRLGIVK